MHLDTPRIPSSDMFAARGKCCRRGASGARGRRWRPIPRSGPPPHPHDPPRRATSSRRSPSPGPVPTEAPARAGRMRLPPPFPHLLRRPPRRAAVSSGSSSSFLMLDDQYRQQHRGGCGQGVGRQHEGHRERDEGVVDPGRLRHIHPSPHRLSRVLASSSLSMPTTGRIVLY